MLIWMTTVCGQSHEELDDNLKCFQNAAINVINVEGKCTCTNDSIKLLGYHISNGVLQPDSDRVKPLLVSPAVLITSRFSRKSGLVFCGVVGFLKTCGLLGFGLVSIEICLLFGLVSYLFYGLLFFKFYGTFSVLIYC